MQHVSLGQINNMTCLVPTYFYVASSYQGCQCCCSAESQQWEQWLTDANCHCCCLCCCPSCLAARLSQQYSKNIAAFVYLSTLVRPSSSSSSSSRRWHAHLSLDAWYACVHAPAVALPCTVGAGHGSHICHWMHGIPVCTCLLLLCKPPPWDLHTHLHARRLLLQLPKSSISQTC
jgi:hypothetical protein